MGSGMSVSGLQEMKRKLQEQRDAMQRRAAAALYQEGEAIMTRSKSDFVPVDLGTLRDSGMVSPPDIQPDGAIEVTLSFGGAASAYALAVHENPSEFDPPSWEGVDVNFHPAGHGPKYLERPLNEATDGMMERVAKAAMEG